MSVYSVHVNLLLPYVVARASEAFCRFAFGARSGVAQAARWPSVAANFKTDLLIKWKNRTKHHVCIQDLLNRLRAHCARWSEVVNYQSTA